MEEGVNLFIEHLQRQRPSLFNYGSPYVVAKPNLWCVPIESSPGVSPLMTTESALPVLGSNGIYSLDWCVQFREPRVDFYPGNTIALPQELGLLQRQEFALQATICGGIACPLEGSLEKLPPAPEWPDEDNKITPSTILTRGLACFCVDLFARGRVELEAASTGNHKLRGRLLGLEIQEVKPEGLENSLECYISTVLQLVVIPRASVELPRLALDLLELAHIGLEPSTSVPHNPSVAKDQIEVFIDFTVTTPPP